MKFKVIYSWIFIVFFTSDLYANHSELKSTSNGRQKVNFNREWKFELGDPKNAEQTSFKDTNWQNVGLPHSFSMPYFLSPDFYIGYGWYRKNFNLKALNSNRHYALEFEGVFQVAEVFVNGISVGKHRGGYNGFSIDITAALKKGDNLIAVRVNNIWDAQLAPRAGEHVFSGGIYRDVWMVETNEVSVDWYGTFVTTPKLSADAGIVNIKTELNNKSKVSKNGVLETSLIDLEGKSVAKFSSTFSLGAGKNTIVDQNSPTINHPNLWSPANPVLYKAVSTVIINGKVVDTYETSFGMRWVEWTADKGFFINGKHHYFKGANLHQDRAGWGDAGTNQGFERDIKMMKDAGFDMVRGSHYPHDPAFSAACDKLGMLFWSENCFWGIGGFKREGDWSSSAYPTLEKDEKPFENSVKESLKEMIRIHRNHPSIIAWSMSNEPFFSVPEQMPKVRKFLKDLVDLSHQLDPTRAAAIGGSQRGEIDVIGDIAGYNGDGAKLYLNPGFPSVVSEYGSTIADRPGEYVPGYGELQEEQFDWRSGQIIWCGFDHGSIAGHFGSMGLVDYFRLPKRQWYWYRNAYMNVAAPKWPENGQAAAVKLTADKTTIDHADGTDDVQLIVAVTDKDGNAISNSPDVKLEVISGPGEFPTGKTILFQANSDIAIREGKAAIELRSYYAGKTVIRASSEGLISAEITIVSKGSHVFSSAVNKNVSRPYVAFQHPKKQVNENTINLLAERPTKVSSAAEGHSPMYANDGDLTSYWESKHVDQTGVAWWQVDMENIYNLSKIILSFKDIQPKYIIETSMDGVKWERLNAQSGESTAAVKEEVIKTANKGRFLRVTFHVEGPDKTVHIFDIQAFGQKAN